MKNLITKEFRLAASPLTYFFIAASAMAFLPGYPILMSSFFVCLGIFYSFQNAREANDVLFSVLLPVKKTDIVKAKYSFVVIIELVSFIIITAITILRMTALTDAEAYKTNALMNATPLFLAFTLLVFMLFNVIFLGGFFKTSWKIGVPFIIFCVVSMIVVFAADSLHFIPSLASLNTPSGEMMTFQFSALAVSAVIYAAATFLSCRISMARFDRTDL